MSHHLLKVVSGGQTGVDRAALDAAMCCGIEHGGWCPRGRRAEDGVIDERYQLRETESADYAARTERNVVESDGTLILYIDEMTGGTALTWRLAAKHRRARLRIELNEAPVDAAINRVTDWITNHNIGVLNVAGPRESSSPGITQLAESFLSQLFSASQSRPDK